MAVMMPAISVLWLALLIQILQILNGEMRDMREKSDGTAAHFILGLYVPTLAGTGQDLPCEHPYTNYTFYEEPDPSA